MSAILESKKLCVLITNTYFAQRTGSELYARDLALALLRLGHKPMLYSPRLGPLADELRKNGIPVVDDLDSVAQAPDLIHGQHHLETMTALTRFPSTPALFVCHGWLPWQEAPPVHPRILRYVAVSEATHDRLVFQGGVPPDKIVTSLNFVDLDVFLPRSPLPKRPSKALVFSNQASELNYLSIVRDACKRRDIELDVIGLANGNPSAAPQDRLGNYDLIFARGRSAIESLAVGAAVICCDIEGMGEMITPDNLDHMRRNNFGLRILDRPVSVEHLDEQISHYDAQSATKVSRQLRASAGIDKSVGQILACYRDLLRQWRSGGEQSEAPESPAISRYLRGVSMQAQELQELQAHAEKKLQEERHIPVPLSRMLEHERQLAEQLRMDLAKLSQDADELRDENAIERGATEFWQSRHQALVAQSDGLRGELIAMAAAQAAQLSQLAEARSTLDRLQEQLERTHGTLTWRWRESLLAIKPLRRAYLFLRSTFRPHSTAARTTVAEDQSGSDKPTVAPDSRIACVVMGLGNPATLIDAVRSLQQQDVPVEIVVVNSGGDSPVARLRAAGFEVKIVHRPDRLFPGAVRNIGIAVTDAPVVSFLAADCVAEPGWARHRLLRHLSGSRVVSSAVTPAQAVNLWSWVSYINLFAMRMPGVARERALHYGASYERRIFAEHGLFRTDLRSGEDTEFNRRLPADVFEWAPEVRSAHRHPTTLLGLLRDQYGRGTRMAAACSTLSGQPFRRRVAADAFLRMPGRLRIAWNAAQSGQRRYVMFASILMPPAVIAYALGALSGPAPKPEAATPGTARPLRLLAVLACRNEMRFLPGYFANASAQVDGIIALDDGSTDGSGDFIAAQDSTLELIRLPTLEPHTWDEPRNRRLLIEAAGRHGADWIVALDADERLERDFRTRAESTIAEGEAAGIHAYAIWFRELWDTPGRYRADGIWSRKTQARFFRYRADAVVDDRSLHGHWAPLNSVTQGGFPQADLCIYHLRMIHADDRQARQARYQQMDPDRRWQAIGYDYLTDDSALQLAAIPEGREYEPMPPVPSQSGGPLDHCRGASAGAVPSSRNC